MRKCFWLRWHDRHGRFNALRRLGVRGRALGVALAITHISADRLGMPGPDTARRSW